ncbi:MAG: DUF262 and DUF1524 domain-containing protein [Planctomycetota bacterium]
MQAKETRCLKFLKQTAQFVIPIYQRPYSWSQKECRQLWDDILRSGRDDDVDSHFIGSIVYVQDGLHNLSDVPRLLVIDGQQRLTTLNLFVLALAAAVRARDGEEGLGGIDPGKLKNYHLVNAQEEGDEYHKLVLTYADRDTLFRLVTDQPIHGAGVTPSTRIAENFGLFSQLMRDASADDLAAAHAGLGKLVMIDVSLDRQHDDPQLIFESLNSTGLDLSQADLIRNYVLMGLAPEPQKRLFEDHWQPMERAFGTDAYLKHFDRFVRHFLTMKTRKIPKIRQVYRAFKDYCRHTDRPIEEVVAELHRFAGYYVRFTRLQPEPDPALDRLSDHLDRLQVDTAHPLLLELYHDQDAGRLSLQGLRELVGAVESYVFRRVLCDIPTNTLNKTFSTLAGRFDRSDPDTYVRNMQATMLVLRGPARFPADAEVINHLQTKDVYALRTRNYLLEKLENYDQGKERVNAEHFTVEHVLPQNPRLPQAWRDVLGPDWKDKQERWLHTLGNLTLTGYNSELRDRPFVDKRDHPHGFRRSPLWLNRSLADAERWDEPAIRTRGQLLAERAVRVWPRPRIDADELAAVTGSEDRKYTLDDHPKLTGSVRELFDELDRAILGLDPDLERSVNKLTIGYRLNQTVCEINALRKGLRLHLNAKPAKLDDPAGLVKDVTGKGHWGAGDSRVLVRKPDQIEPVLGLIRRVIALRK